MLRFKPQYYKRFYYEANGTDVYKLPKGNLFSAINMLLKLEVNIASGGASNAPDYQVFNAIETIELIKDSKTLFGLCQVRPLRLCSREHTATDKPRRITWRLLVQRPLMLKVSTI